MSLNLTDSYAALENARAQQQVALNAKKSAEALKQVATEKEAQAAKISEQKSYIAETATNKVRQLNLRVNTAQIAYTNALNQLSVAQRSGDKSAIASAEQAVQITYKDLLRLQEDVSKAEQEAKMATQEAVLARTEAEKAQKELEKADTALDEANKNLNDADKAVKEAEEAYEAAKAEEAKGEEEPSRLTEEEAIKEGYTVIHNAEELIAIANNLNGKYILMSDIDLSGVAWVPIGNEKDPFTGKLNGNGYSIKNLNIAIDNGKDTQNVGFFGVTNGADISDIKFENASITTPDTYNKGSVGIVAGTAIDTNFENIYVSGNVEGHQKTGGLVGTVADSPMGPESSTFKGCTADVNINSSYYAGGLIGYVNSTYTNDMVIENCHTSGNINVNEKCAGGLIGEAGSTIVTINKCSSSTNITCNNQDNNEISWLLETARCGGFIGCANGTKIAICNSEYNGNINAEGEFKGDYYGYYMNDAHVTIFELSAGLPAQDILNIDGVDRIQPVIDPKTGEAHYEITVSTLNGMDKIVAMIRENPDLAKIVTFNVNFDFEAMDAKYTSTTYSQYGVVQTLKEDEYGTVINDVYIDNEIDVESTFHEANFVKCEPTDIITPVPYKKTMIPGLWKDSEGNYYVQSGLEFIPTTLQFFFENQRTNVVARLSQEEVKLRENITNMVYFYQSQMYDALKEKLGLPADTAINKIDEPEYKYLKELQENGGTLSPEEQLALTVYELDYNICNLVSEATKNQGCGMGGDASFLDESLVSPLKDEDGRICYTTLSGLELRQKIDEEGNLVTDSEGEPVYETLNGEEYTGFETVYTIKSYSKNDEDGNKLFTDENGNSVTEIKDDEGNSTYCYEDGSTYEGEIENLTEQVEIYNPAQAYEDVKNGVKEMLEEIKE